MSCSLDRYPLVVMYDELSDRDIALEMRIRSMVESILDYCCQP